MINEDALFDVIDAAVTAAAPPNQPTALTGAVVFSSTRGNVSDQIKTIRIQTFGGFLSPQTASALKEQNNDFVIQCLAKTEDVGLEAEQSAQSLADQIGKEVFALLMSNPTLSGAVCDIDLFDGDENFDRMVIDIGANKYGSFYLYGKINPV